MKRNLAMVAGLLAAVLLGAVAGGALVRSSSQGALTVDGGAGLTAPTDAKTVSSEAMSADAAVGSAPVASSRGGTGATANGTADSARHVVRTGTVSVRVKDIAATIASVRAATAASGGEIQSLSYGTWGGRPVEGAAAAQDASTDPRSASIVIRVPSSKLAQVRSAVSRLGVVTAESLTEDDVTQAAVDMKARLRNLRAEEARLRSFLSRARTVGEMLAVQRELSRVRGEIESLQAQSDALAGQVAMATLTLDVFEPGAVVRPDGTNWGFSAAVTRGVQAAASLMTSVVTTLIAASPLIVAALLLWLIVHIVRRRRSGRTTPDPAAGVHV